MREITTYGRMEVKKAVRISTSTTYAAHYVTWIAVEAMAPILHVADAISDIRSLIYYKNVGL
jgi:hypothetical protein